MKKTYFIFAFVICSLFSSAQIRTSLFEEFTGENCNPCASTNPALNITLLSATNAPKVIAIKWQVPIPSAPSLTWSLYRTNQAEIDWRYKSSASGGYGYPSQNTPTNAVTSGINSAPAGRLDGRHQWDFGATSDHPFYISNAVISSAQSQTTNFSINMSTAWDATFSNCAVTVTVQSSTAFTSTGTLVYRLCLVERTINFDSPPGTNGEKDFYDAVRKSYPTATTGTAVTSMGTVLPNTWTAGQTQTFVVNCAVPSYVYDKGQMSFVGFVQDDGTRLIYQAARTLQPAIPNDAKAVSISIPSVQCTNTLMPSVTIKNNGINAITAMTVTPVLDGVTGANIFWTGNLAPTATTNLVMNVISTSSGAHTYSYNITGVSGGDVVMSNNTKKIFFITPTTNFPGPVTEGFVSTTFPPTNWALFNLDNGVNTFTRTAIAGGYGTSAESMLFQVNSITNGDIDEIYLPPTDLTGITLPELSFDLSYCQIFTTSKDSLKAFVSGDCGNTWNMVWANGGSSMATAPTNSLTFFVPTASQWSTAIVPLTTYSNAPQLLVKFWGKSNAGNRLFLDNINLQQSNLTAIKNSVAFNAAFDVYPNPAADEATVFLTALNDQEIKLTVTNSIGQMVYNKKYKLNAGSNNVSLDCKNLAAGVYIVVMESDKNKQTKKLIISK
ncbi:MAG: T9SS type A sorting domain-containing protein [Bacteroidetes bacterium]|nr:T9SS type A sorting domain-containing protein [Bacteroidota bacterium]